MANRKTGKIGKALVGSSLVLMALLITFTCIYRNERFLHWRIGKEVARMDREMTTLIQKGLNHEELAKSETGLTVFMSDTLVFWNNNEANPKLMKRKTVVGCDTICPLLSGQYYVKSYQNGSMTYYVFRKVNTTYQIENKYFVNQFLLVPKFVDAKIEIVDQNEGVCLTNEAGKAMTYYKFTS